MDDGHMVIGLVFTSEVQIDDLGPPQFRIKKFHDTHLSQPLEFL